MIGDSYFTSVSIGGIGMAREANDAVSDPSATYTARTIDG